MRKAPSYRSLLFVVLASLICGPKGKGQTAVYLEFSAGNPENWIYGGTAGVYHDPWHILGVEAGVDARVALLGNGQTPDTPRVYGVTVGPRLAFHVPTVPIRPYAEVLAGAGHVRYGAANTGNFEYQVVGGLDVKIISRLDWRLFELAYTAFPGLNTNSRYPGFFNPEVGTPFSPKLLSTGLVLRLP